MPCLALPCFAWLLRASGVTGRQQRTRCVLGDRNGEMSEREGPQEVWTKQPPLFVPPAFAHRQSFFSPLMARSQSLKFCPETNDLLYPRYV